MACVKACPYSNVAIETRAPASELWSNLKKRDFSLAVAVIVMTFGSLMNAGGMINGFTDVEASFARTLNLNGFWAYTGIFLIVTIVAPLLFGWLTSFVSLKMSRNSEYTQSQNFKYFAIGLIPLSLGIWVSHYLFHFIVGGAGVWPTIQNLFKQLGFPIFGQPQWATTALLPYNFILPLQLFFIYGGFLLSCLSLYQISRQLFVKKRKTARRTLIAWIALAFLIALVAMYIMFQPMQARGTFST
jgi:hypothetical protein